MKPIVQIHTYKTLPHVQAHKTYTEIRFSICHGTSNAYACTRKQLEGGGRNESEQGSEKDETHPCRGIERERET